MPTLKRDQRPIPESIRHYLVTGQRDSNAADRWCLFEALHGPLGASRAVIDNWDREAALEPYRARLRAEGVELFEFRD